jgi:TatD DNase family protein
LRLIDSHSHVQSEAFDRDREQVIAAARDAGVERMLVPGWDLASSRAALQICANFDLDAGVGIHPHVARASEADFAAIAELARDPAVVAVGETGLDYDRGFSPRDDQLANLRRHFDLAKAVGKPVIIHCRSKAGERDAHDDLLRELVVAGAGTTDWLTAEGRPPALLHSFSGPVDYGEAALSLGLAISFSGLAFRKGEEASATVARLVPTEQLLVETDCPYLSPPGAPKRRNEPRYVETTASWLAQQRGTEPETLGHQLVDNYDRFFSRSSERSVSAD